MRGRTSPPPRAAGRRGRPSAARPSARPRRSTPAASARPSSRPVTALATASATARSAPGSSTRTPPATLTKTSADPAPIPAWRPSTASTSASRLRSIPLQTRRGGTSSDGETSAWTSTSSGREPSIAASTTLPGARVASPTKRARGIRDLDQPARAHLEHADVVGRAEAVLERPQRPVRALALALELQHAVDEVLEHARAGQRALLGHVADEQHRDPARLRQPRDPVGDLAHLADASPPRRSGRCACSVCTESITHTSGRSASASPARCPGRSRPAPGTCSAAPGSRSARSRICAADSSPETYSVRRPAPSRLPSAIDVSVDLPMPGRAADQHERAGHEPAAEDPVQLADPGLQPRVPRRLDLVQPQRLDRAPLRRRARAARRALLLDERVPLAAAGALPHPARRLGGAGGADEDGGWRGRMVR